MQTGIRLQCATREQAANERARLIALFGDSIELDEPRAGRASVWFVYGRFVRSDTPNVSSYRLGESMGTQAGYNVGYAQGVERIKELTGLINTTIQTIENQYDRGKVPAPLAALIKKLEQYL